MNCSSRVHSGRELLYPESAHLWPSWDAGFRIFLYNLNHPTHRAQCCSPYHSVYRRSGHGSTEGGQDFKKTDIANCSLVNSLYVGS